MKEILLELEFDMEDIESLLIKLDKYNNYNISKIINLLISNNLSKEYIREIIVSKDKIFSYDPSRIEFMIDAIKSNNDIIEETLFDLL